MKCTFIVLGRNGPTACGAEVVHGDNGGRCDQHHRILGKARIGGVVRVFEMPLADASDLDLDEGDR